MRSSRLGSARSREKEFSIKVNNSKKETQKVITQNRVKKQATRELNEDLNVDSTTVETNNEKPMERVEDDLDQIEKMWEVQDKWKLLAWGLKQKQALIFRMHFLQSTDHLKDKFRIILGRFLRKRADKQFEEMRELIETFDLEADLSSCLTGGDAQPKIGGKLMKSKKNVKTDLASFGLQIIQENANEDLEESRNTMAFVSADVLSNREQKVARPAKPREKPVINSKEEAVAIISRFFLNFKTKQSNRQMWRDLDEKYKGLPQSVRLNYVKIWIAKQDQSSLKTKMNNYK